MKKILLGLFAGACLCACTSELDEFSGGTVQDDSSLKASIPAYTFESETRVAISNDLQNFTWASGDQLGLYYNDGATAAAARFTVLQGGSSTGSFSNAAFALNENTTYYAFYPFDMNAMVTSANVDFRNQKQTANASAAHLGAYNYMVATAATDSNGETAIAFQNIGAVMQAVLTMPETATLTSLTVTSDGTPFITKGTASMKTGTITGKENSKTVTLALDNISVNKGATLTANLLVAPVNMYGSTLRFSLTGSNGFIYSVNIAGKNMSAGKAYRYTGSAKGTAAAPDNVQAVDLGLPSGLKWANMNVGATSMTDYGDYFAWGETEGYNSGKTTFTKENYKFYKTESTVDADGFDITYYGYTKYVPSKYSDKGFKGFYDDKTELDLEDDAAHANWGGNWRMPTIFEVKELLNNCSWVWVRLNGVNGYKVSGTNGNYIFLPASVLYTYYESFDSGLYWTKTTYDGDCSYILTFDSSYCSLNPYSYKRWDWPSHIRPVCE